jgi:hypothetical protein
MSDKTLQEEMAELRRAWLDLMFAMLWPIRWLIRRIPGLEPKPWIKEREVRERWKDEKDD